jgi:[ribosomal protein S18]-alanine N-acetyltransferase
MPDKPTSTSLLFEPMETTDLPRIMEIERGSYSFPWTQTMFLSELFDNPFSHAYVAREEEERKIVGYVIFWIVIDEFHLLNVAVDPTRRKRGIAERLIRLLFDIAQKRGVKKGTLEARASNFPAQQLYRKFGFREVGIRRNYYQGPTENALLFQCDIEICPVSSEADGASGISGEF